MQCLKSLFFNSEADFSRKINLHSTETLALRITLLKLSVDKFRTEVNDLNVLLQHQKLLEYKNSMNR